MPDRTRQSVSPEPEPPEEGLLTENTRPGILEVAYDAVEAARLTGEPARAAAMTIVVAALDEELRNP